MRAAREAQPQLTRVCLMIGFATARALLFIIALHVLAALKHHVVDRDRLLERMWPGRTIKVTLLTALPAVAQQRKAPKIERKAKAAAKRRRARRRGERAAAVWTTNAATF